MAIPMITASLLSAADEGIPQSSAPPATVTAPTIAPSAVEPIGSGIPATEQVASEQVASEQVASESNLENPTTSDTLSLPADEIKLRFAFSGAPWREVLRWLAEEAGLALHVGELPVGSFTYSDPDEFTVDQAISRVNLFLIPQGYGVVKRGSLLSVISLADPRSLQQLDALAVSTTIAELNKYSSHEILKCHIPIGDLNVEDVLAELRPLMLMTSPVVLPRSKQIIVTDTMAKVASVVSVVESLKVPVVEQVVKRFDLKHVDVSAVMAVAAPHIGVPAGQMEGVEINVSSDVGGKILFVTGTPEKVAKLQSLIEVLDLQMPEPPSAMEMTLRSHTVTGDNLQAVYDVLQTVLAGKSLRLSMQPTTNSIVALADTESHRVIEQTIQEMQAPAIEFAVVELGSLDPYFTLNLIDEMFAGQSSASDSRRDRDDTDSVPAPPKVDADPGNRRLFVRGTAQQIDQVKQLVAGLKPSDASAQASEETVRVLPLQGQQRSQILEAATRSWQGKNSIVIVPSTGELSDLSAPVERIVSPDDSSSKPLSNPARPASTVMPQPPLVELSADETAMLPAGEYSHQENRSAFVSLPSESTPVQPNVSVMGSAKAKLPESPAPIRSQLIPQGILLQSDDPAALDRFERQLREIAENTRRSPSPPVIYYLKYVKAEDAVKMLADLIDGGRSLAETPGNTLIRGNSTLSAKLSSTFPSSLTTNKDGVTTVIAGTATIVSDARLNRLIVQGTVSDIAVIDEYMKIVDKGNSITSVETFGQSHVIELKYTNAKDVCEMLKQAFSQRIANTGTGTPQPNQRPGEGNGGRPGKEGERQEGGRDVAEKPTRGRVPEMTIAAHEPSNTLIVTAPDSLYAEVLEVVESIDTMSEQVVEVIPASSGIDVEAILKRLNGEQFERPETRSQSGSTNSSPSNSSRRGRS